MKRRKNVIDGAKLVSPDNLELMFMYQELLGKGLKWEKKRKL